MRHPRDAYLNVTYQMAYTDRIETKVFSMQRQTLIAIFQLTKDIYCWQYEFYFRYNK